MLSRKKAEYLVSSATAEQLTFLLGFLLLQTASEMWETASNASATSAATIKLKHR